MAKVTTLKSRDHVFEFLHKYIAQVLPDSYNTNKGSLKVETQESIMYMGTQVVMHWRQLANKLAEDHYVCTFYAPATWWQMFKQEAAPGWFRRRYGVKVKPHRRTVKFTRYATYPQANLAIPLQDKFRAVLGHEVIEDTVTDMGDLGEYNE